MSSLLGHAAWFELVDALTLPGLHARVCRRSDSDGIDVSVRWYARDVLAGVAAFRIWRAARDEVDFHGLHFEPAFQGHGFYTQLRRQLASWGARNQVVRVKITSGGAARETFLRTGFRAKPDSAVLTGSAADLVR